MLTLQNTIQFASQKEKNIYFTFKEDMLKIMANQCKNKNLKIVFGNWNKAEGNTI